VLSDAPHRSRREEAVASSFPARQASISVFVATVERLKEPGGQADPESRSDQQMKVLRGPLGDRFRGGRACPAGEAQEVASIAGRLSLPIASCTGVTSGVSASGGARAPRRCGFSASPAQRRRMAADRVAEGRSGADEILALEPAAGLTCASTLVSLSYPQADNLLSPKRAPQARMEGCGAFV